VVSGSLDHTLKVWDVASELERRSLTGHTGQVTSCAVSPDGTWIATSGYDKTLRIWDTATGREKATHADAGVSAAGPDGTWLVTSCSGSGSLFGPVGRIVLRGNDHRLKVRDRATGQVRAVCSGHTDHVPCCAVGPDGTWIVSGSLDNSLKVWEATTGRLRATLTGHTHGVLACATTPDGTEIVSAGHDGTIRIWDAATGGLQATLSGHTGTVTSCAVSPDGTWIVSGGWDKTLRVWDAATGSMMATLIGHTDSVSACAVSPDGAWIMSAGDQTFRLWDTGRRTERAVLVAPADATAVAFHPSAPVVVCGDDAGGVYFAHLRGITYGALGVTPVRRDQALTVLCPACQGILPIQRELLGTDTTCPGPACGARLRINPFVRPPEASGATRPALH
jgi:WD40 repeat protein